MKTQIVLASGNKGKVKELSDMLSKLNMEVVPQSAFDVTEAEETGTTFVENAIIKARSAAQQTGLPAIADDSGIEVDFLNGRPGVWSARYAGADAGDSDNVAKLLEEMTDADETQRTARFHCVLVYMKHANDPTPLICHGSWEGTITTSAHGDGGFGYDPVFHVSQHNCTAAELTKEQKNQLSHRGKALRQLLQQLSAAADS